jgi:hypothetical protein
MRFVPLFEGGELDFLLKPPKSPFFFGSATSTISLSVLPLREAVEQALPRLDSASLFPETKDTDDLLDVILPLRDSEASVVRLDLLLEFAWKDQSDNELMDPRGEMEGATSSYSGTGPREYSGADSRTEATRVWEVRSKTVSDVGGSNEGIWKVNRSLKRSILPQESLRGFEVFGTHLVLPASIHASSLVTSLSNLANTSRLPHLSAFNFNSLATSQTTRTGPIRTVLSDEMTTSPRKVVSSGGTGV